MVLDGGAKGRWIARVADARHRLKVWRGWPAVPLAALCAIALFGFLATPAKHNQNYKPEQRGASQKALPESRQDVAAEIVAHYTKALAWFTGFLAAASIIQGAAIIYQIRLAREEFISTHRPRIKIRGLILFKPKADNESVIMFEVQNGGESYAKIISCRFFLIVEKNSLSPDGDTNTIRTKVETIYPKLPCKLQAGDHVEWRAIADHNIVQYARFGVRASSEIRITVFYQDAHKRVRQCSINRKFNFITRAFEPIPDSEFEYSD